MKKSLSLLLAFALVFSMFSSLALANTELTVEEKFQILKEAGIMAGMADGSSGADQTMTRAQAARVTATLLGLEGIGNPDTRVVTEKPFTDVELNLWYTASIDAVKEAGIFVGNPDGSFGPNDNITVQQLAIVLVNILGLEPVEGAEVEGAADWAAGYVQALIDNGIDFPTNYTEDALRADLINATYVAAVTLGVIEVEAGELAVVSVAPTGARKITVNFNRAVDADDVTFTIKKGAANVAIADEDPYEWSTDKKSVVINLDSKLTEGKYTVTVKETEGAAEVLNGTHEFEAENEKIVSIEFVNANEYIAKSDTNAIAFEAKNQYGEVSDLTGNRFSLIVGHNDASATGHSERQEVNLNVAHANITKDTRVALTIVAPNATTSVTQIFIVGDPPSASKIEVGELELEDDKTRLTAGESAVLNITVYDQYGNRMTKVADIDATTTLISTRGDIIPNDPANLAINGDGNIDINTIVGITSDTDVTLTFIANGSGASVNHVLTVHAPRTPTDVAFGDFSDTVAAGDGTIYLPLIVYDQYGEEMDADDIIANAGEFNIYSDNSSLLFNEGIHSVSDENKGKVKVDVSATKTGNAKVTVMINKNGKRTEMPISIQDPRVPNRIVVDSAPDAKALPGAVTKVKFKIKDQYGKDIEQDYADYAVDFSVDDPKGAFTVAQTGQVADEYNVVHDKELNITANSAANNEGTLKYTAKLVEIDGTDRITISQASVTVQAVKAEVADELSYEVSQVGKLYEIAKHSSVATVINKMSKKIEVKGKDSNGNTVALPATVVKAVYSSNEGIVSVSQNGSEWLVTGEEKGNASLTVTLEPAAGNLKIASQTVEVSDVQPYAESLTVANATIAKSRNTLNTKPIWDGDVAGDIKMVDQYGIEYKNDELVDGELDDHHKVVFTVTNVKGGTVTINNGQLTVGAGVESFTVQVYSVTNGKSVSINVTVF